MNLPSFHFDHPWTWYALWNSVSFVFAFLINSFVEHFSHRYVLHSDKIVKFAYELHDRQHHVIFDGGSRYKAKDDFMRSHIVFTARDYILFLLVTTPLWIGMEFLLRRPIIVGCVLATLAGLQLFNSLHLRFHDPKDTWFQRTRFFTFLCEHHRLHHEDPAKNFNVSFFPIADIFLGTLKK